MFRRVIGRPLRQPARADAFVEGGSFDLPIAHGGNAVLVKPSANDLTATLGHQDAAFRGAFYARSVGTVRPRLVVAVHWDDFFLPPSEYLVALDDAELSAGVDDLIRRLAADDIEFGITQGYQRLIQFGG